MSQLGNQNPWERVYANRWRVRISARTAVQIDGENVMMRFAHVNDLASERPDHAWCGYTTGETGVCALISFKDRIFKEREEGLDLETAKGAIHAVEAAINDHWNDCWARFSAAEQDRKRQKGGLL